MDRFQDGNGRLTVEERATVCGACTNRHTRRHSLARQVLLVKHDEESTVWAGVADKPVKASGHEEWVYAVSACLRGSPRLGQVCQHVPHMLCQEPIQEALFCDRAVVSEDGAAL
jgi:hypothetical protein